MKYTVGRFVSKNANEIPTGLNEFLSDSEVFGCLLASGLSQKSGGDDDSSASKERKKKSLSATFTSQMQDLCELLDSTSCSFIRCVKPNTTMRMGVFERDFVVKQLRAQGILQTCDVLKRGMPTRVAFEEIEMRYRKSAEAVFAKQTSSKKRPLDGLDARGFTAAVLWSLGISGDAYSMGKTRVFFRTGKIALLDRLYSVDLQSDDGANFLSRLRYFESRRRWRRALAKVYVAMFLKQRWERIARERRAVSWVQIRYRYYRKHGRGKKRRRNRRLWRVAYIKVRCLAAFSDEYQLIHETRLNRERLEREAAASIMEIKVEKRSASTILSEAVARGLIAKDVGDNTLEKIREHEEAKQREGGGISSVNLLAVETGDNDDFEDIGEDDILADDSGVESQTLSRTSSSGAPDSDPSYPKKQDVDSLLVDAAASIENKPNVAAAVRKALTCVKHAKGAIRRWMRVLQHRGWEKWVATIKQPALKSETPVPNEETADSADSSVKLTLEKGDFSDDSRVADAWLKADIRRALNELRNVFAKAPRLKELADEVNATALAQLVDPIITKALPEEDDDIWAQLFRPAGTGVKLAAEAATVPPPPPPAQSKGDEENTAVERENSSENSDAVSTLQQQIALLKKQLSAAGVQAVELIPLAQAREKMNAAVRRLMDGDMEAEKEVEK